MLSNRKISALPVQGTNYTVPVSSYNQYIYRGCYANSATVSNISQLALNGSTPDMIKTCYETSKNYLSYPATFFGLKDGSICVFGYDNALASGLIASGNVLSDTQCNQDCGSSSKSNEFFNSSNLQKCGSSTTISLYQLSNSARSLSFKSDKTESLGT